MRGLLNAPVCCSCALISASVRAASACVALGIMPGSEHAVRNRFSSVNRKSSPAPIITWTEKNIKRKEIDKMNFGFDSVDQILNQLFDSPKNQGALYQRAHTSSDIQSQRTGRYRRRSTTGWRRKRQDRRPWCNDHCSRRCCVRGRLIFKCQITNVAIVTTKVLPCHFRFFSRVDPSM